MLTLLTGTVLLTVYAINLYFFYFDDLLSFYLHFLAIFSFFTSDVASQYRLSLAILKGHWVFGVDGYSEPTLVCLPNCRNRDTSKLNPLVFRSRPTPLCKVHVLCQFKCSLRTKHLLHEVYDRPKLSSFQSCSSVF